MYIPNDANSCEISFLHKMYGSSMNTLNLMAIVDNDLANPVLIWQNTGSQTYNWLSENINLDSYKGSTLEFYFEGTTWSGSKNFMAIDDICIDIAVNGNRGLFKNGVTQSLDDKILPTKSISDTQVKLLSSIEQQSILQFQSDIKIGVLNIHLYDINGNRIQTLANGINIENGYFNETIDKSNLSAGMYLIQVEYLTDEDQYTKTLKLAVFK